MQATEGYVLGIDPGTSDFGLALSHIDSKQVVCARSVKLPNVSTNRHIAVSVCTLLYAIHRRYPLRHICVEQQLRSPMIEVAQTVVVWAYTQNISCEMVSAHTWRWRVGSKSQGSWAKNKKHSVRFVQALGYNVLDHNVAEAVLIAKGATEAAFPTDPNSVL